MIVSCLFNKLPSVSHATLLCFVRGHFITILLVAKCLHRPDVPGFLLSLDFFHAYHRVSVQWLNCVLKALGFEVVHHHWVATLHCHASACLALHTVVPDMAVEFSIRQGDLAVSVFFFAIYVEPFLVSLEALLCGLFVDGIRETSLCYMDDVYLFSED
jgi:hypothetical protein